MSEMEKTEVPSQSIGEALQTAALAIPVSVVRAWVVSDMWNWFVMPLGVSATSIAQMFGIILMLRIAVAQTRTDDKEIPAFKDMTKRAINTCIALACTWLIAKGVYLLTLT